jgi:hypothetical protein
MYNRTKTPAFVLGLFSGSINAFLGIIALVILISLSSTLSQFSYVYDATPQILLFIGIILVCFLNYIGALVCMRKRIAGGAIMLITAILLLILTIIVLSNVAESASNPFGNSSSDLFGYASPFGALSSVGTVVIVLWIIIELVSVTGAILCFSPARPNAYMPIYNQPYGQPLYQQPYGQPNPYQQPYGQQPQQPGNTENS